MCGGCVLSFYLFFVRLRIVIVCLDGGDILLVCVLLIWLVLYCGFFWLGLVLDWFWWKCLLRFIFCYCRNRCDCYLFLFVDVFVVVWLLCVSVWWCVCYWVGLWLLVWKFWCIYLWCGVNGWLCVGCGGVVFWILVFCVVYCFWWLLGYWNWCG